MFSFRHGLRSLVLLAVTTLGLLATGIGRLAAAPPPSDLPWKYDLTKGLDEARKAGKRVLVDFTGVNCIPCKTNETNVFPLPEVRTRLARFVLVKLYTDQIPNSFYTPEVLKKFDGDTEQQEKDAEPNRQWMAKFGGQGVPLYVVVAPTAEGYREVARFDKGLISDKKEGASVKDFLGFLDRGLKGTPPTADRIDFQAVLKPAAAPPGAVVQLIIQGKPRPGFHTYPLTVRTAEQDVGYLSKLLSRGNKDFRPLWPVQESKPEFADEGKQGVFLEHAKPFTWTQDFLVSPEAKPGKTSLAFAIKLEVCDTSCVSGEHKFALPFDIATGSRDTPKPGVQERLNNKPTVEVVPVPGDFKRNTPVGQGGTSPKPEDEGLLVFLLTSGGAAFLMLLTPCVFPMIPITVSFFLKQSEKENHKPLISAAVYTGTIIVVLTSAVFLLGKFVNVVADNRWVNLGIGAVLVYFALSLFGMYEIELPSFLTRFTASREGRGGYAGVFFMALTFTVTSFTCTGPFLGPLLAASAELKPSTDKLILGALVYSATFALPFFFLALFPSLLKKLPKGGGWLNAVKVVMGFVELGAALKFLANTDILLNPGAPVLFTYDTVLCAWMALSVMCALYLLGVYRLPHDSPVESLSVPRMLLGSIFFGFAVYMVPLLNRERPEGSVGKGLKAFLPLDTRAKKARSGNGAGELVWLKDYRKAWEQAVKEKKLLLIDFTGVNCTNCRDNEENIFPDAAVQEQLSKYVRVQLYTDSVPDPSLSNGEALSQGSRNLRWQEETFKDVSRPLYIVFHPDLNTPVEGDTLKGTELGRQKGKLPSPAEFAQFLADSLRK